MSASAWAKNSRGERPTVRKNGTVTRRDDRADLEAENDRLRRQLAAARNPGGSRA